MLYSGTDPESYITDYTLVYEEKEPGLPKLVSATTERERDRVREPYPGSKVQSRCEGTLNLSTTTSQKCAAVPRRARI